MKVDVTKMSAEEKRILREQLLADERAAEAKKQSDREAYKKLVTETVESNFQELNNLSLMISQIKALIFNNFAHVIDLKNELYGVKEGQQSHTFSNADSSLSVTIGYRVIDNYDDTVNSGIEKVKSWIKRQAKDEAAAQLVDIINDLLKRDNNGNLKASRVLELQKHADKVDDDELTDGVRIIREAYKPKRTSYFVEANYTDAGGKKQTLPLSITAVPFPETEVVINL